jgi:hypothetical protein
MIGEVPGPPLYSPGGRNLVGYKVGVLVGVQGNSTRSQSASFLAVPGVYARQAPEHVGVESSSSSSLEASSSSS